MTDLVNTLKLDDTQIHVLLSNHEMFTPEQVKIAARLKVQRDKQKRYDAFERNQQIYNDLRLLQPSAAYHMQSPYIMGSGLQEALFGGRLF